MSLMNRKTQRIKHALGLIFLPGVLVVWGIGWAMYCVGDRPKGRLKNWLETVARGK